MIKKETPQVLKGFRDYLPQEQMARVKVIRKISEVFERFGFSPIDTPALESYSLLKGKIGEEEKLIYKFKDLGGREVALRYDLTLPLARVVANYQNLPKPFKRYQIAPVWRAENPQKGRFREFVQCDVDIVGTNSWVADAEVIATLAQAIKSLEIGEIIVKINNREMIDKTLTKLKIAQNKRPKFLRILDKMDKVGKKTTLESLKDQGFKPDLLTNYESIIKTESMDYMEKMESMLAGLGVDDIKFDPFLARGLDYYTGTIFEFLLKDKPEFGSICGGGRYNNLIGKISGQDVPAVGGSIGLDRMLAAISEMGVISPQTATEVLVMNLDASLVSDYLNILTNLRAAGIDCEMYYESVKLDKQFKYAESKNMKLAIIYGAEEQKNKTVNIKNLEEKKQVTVELDDLATEIKSMLW